VASSVLSSLQDLLPADRLTDDPAVLASYVHDEAEWATFGAPVALVRPRTTAEVQAVVLACVRTGTPLVTRGAGTGLSGGANAVDGCVVLSTEKMTAITEINSVERLAVVQPGVVNDHLRAACAEHGLWYPPDPASAPWSTIGGNVATNAGGLCCVKYGVTRDYVLELEVVNGLGEVVRLGRRTAKGVVGYDMVGLMVGSEGTLGVVTEVTVRLRNARAPERTVVGFFDSVVDAGRAVEAIGAGGVVPSALELVDRHCLKAVDDWKNMGSPSTRTSCCSAAATPPARRATTRRPPCSAASRSPGPRSRRRRPTPPRPRRCSTPAGSPTRPSSGSDRC
jgi:glycolate oxidase